MRVECTKGERASRRMLKKSLFSPAQPGRAETRLFPCGVLASLRGSTYRSVRLASSFVAALLGSLFEHPATELIFFHRQTSEATSDRKMKGAQFASNVGRVPDEVLGCRHAKGDV